MITEKNSVFEYTDIKFTNKTELLEKKLSLILRMRDLTASADLSNGQAEENYITLMSGREDILKRLKALDLCLAECGTEDGEEILLGQISDVSGQILEMDNQMAMRIPELMRKLKGRLKQIKAGRSINRAYHTDIFGIVSEGGYRLKK